MSRPSIRFTIIMCLFAGVAAFAPAAQADRCRKIRAEIDLSAGTIDGNFGLNGTVVFVADSSGTPPATAPAGSSVFSGILTITTDRGVLEMRETGMFSNRTGNPGGPVLSSWGEVLSGTGRYQDVIGDVSFFGHIIDGAFLVDVTGELCEL
jgi:hypothetical protein